MDLNVSLREHSISAKGRTGHFWVNSLRAMVVVLIAALVGCAVPPVNDPARIGPFFRPRNVSGESALPANLRRVVLLPVSGVGVIEPETAVTLDGIFIAELQKKNRFEVVTLSREEARRRFGFAAFDSTAPLPTDFLSALQREFAADAVVFVDITTYRAYHPLVLGVRAKCVTIDGSRMLWSFDNVFSASDNSVANSARRHYLESDRGGIPADMSHSVLQSPARFAGYVAAATFETLPPVFSPVLVPGKNARR